MGANLAVDIPYHYLRFFLEDDQKLQEIEKNYSAGKMMTGEVKKILIEIMQKMITEHQQRRSQITDADVRKFMEIRPLKF